jgi:hypothetical protein
MRSACLNKQQREDRRFTVTAQGPRSKVPPQEQDDDHDKPRDHHADTHDSVHPVFERNARFSERPYRSPTV